MIRFTMLSVLMTGLATGPASWSVAQAGSGTRPVSRGTPVCLFDGYSLKGWARRDGSPHPGWVVDSGALYRQAGGGDLYYQFPLRDFELSFQWRISPGGNSGLKYRVKSWDNQWLGCEYQLLDDAAHRDANKSAGLYDVLDPPDDKPATGPDVWHQSRIVVCGNRIEHWLNGIRTVNATVGGPEWKEAVAGSKFAGRPGFGENRKGRLFLQDHGDPVWFRHLVLTPLDCDPCQTSPSCRVSPCGCVGPWPYRGPRFGDRLRRRSAVRRR